ncbi:MAG: dihydropteroate synthase [Elusimicrobia bacterium]|nr:dihydropteroate synthase [Elusimicrobiota bacterium]
MPSSKPPLPEAGLAELFRPSRSRAPLIMGIVNVTPDSFYPGSRTPDAASAAQAALRQVEAGADLVDIGGQSTRPGSDPVSEAEELRRVLPVFSALAGRIRVPLSIDTDKAEVARRCLEAGAVVVNDVSALRGDPGMARAARAASAVILMHRGGGSPKTMQDEPRYGDVVREVGDFLAERREAFARAGGDPGRLLFDPGIGFGKTVAHNLSLLKHLSRFNRLGPVVLGVSRKSFIGRALGADDGPEARLEGSLAAAAWAARQGVRVLRVHDVAATRRVLALLAAIEEAD